MSEHTKGELKMSKANDEIIIMDINGNIVANLTVNQTINYIQSVALPNGRHLVKCWNCHDDLVAACEVNKKMLDICARAFLGTGEPPDPEELANAIVDNDAALNKVKAK